MSATRVLIADRPGPARRAVASVLSGLPDVTIVGAEGDAATIHRAVEAERPDIVVIDDRLVDQWREDDYPLRRLIVLGVGDERAYAERAARLHAVAWLPKECAGERLPDAVDAARRSLRRSAWGAPAVAWSGAAPAAAP